MRGRNKGIVSVLLTVLMISILASPVQADVAYSKQCDTTWDWQFGGFTVDQEYDGQDWDPESNESQSARFWQPYDDVNISLSIILENNDNIRMKTLDFQYIVDVSVHASPENYKIIEGANYSSNNQYSNTVPVDYQDNDTRNLTIEVYSVTWQAWITLHITVKSYDGAEQIGEYYCGYHWVGPT